MNKELEIAIRVVYSVWEGRTVRRSWTGVRHTGYRKVGQVCINLEHQEEFSLNVIVVNGREQWFLW